MVVELLVICAQISEVTHCPLAVTIAVLLLGVYAGVEKILENF